MVSFAAIVVGKADGLAQDSHSLFLRLVTWFGLWKRFPSPVTSGDRIILSQAFYPPVRPDPWNVKLRCK